MPQVVMLLKAVAILAAAGLVGNWFLRLVKETKAKGLPWYRPYVSVPGLLILVALLIPILLRFFK